jgi:hypothetical protein
VEIARQLTLIDMRLFKQIDIRSLLVSKVKNDAAIQGFIKRFNFVSFKRFMLCKVTQWFISQILSFSSHKDRALVIKNCISIAQQCAEMGNINSLKAIIGSLQSAAVHRLKSTWDVRRMNCNLM